MTFTPQQLQYPPPLPDIDEGTGVYPVDFIIQDIIERGLYWFTNTPGAENFVFSHLNTKFLKDKYGQPKINEIKAFILKYDIRIVQHFALIAEQVPCISIQLLDGSETTDRAGLNDHEGTEDQTDSESNVIGRSEVKFSPIMDNVHIGIHANNTPDLAKYLYYLIIYILVYFKADLENRGLHLGTFRATDISRLNDYLPENVYSRFINFSVWSKARVEGVNLDLPIVTKITGASISPSEEVTDINAGITTEDIG